MQPPSIRHPLCPQGSSVDQEEGPSGGEPRAACLLLKNRKGPGDQGAGALRTTVTSLGVGKGGTLLRPCSPGMK